MGECKRCHQDALTAMAYGVEVCVQCGYPLVATDRSAQLRSHIEHNRLSEQSRVARYQERIAELEQKLKFREKLQDRMADGHRRLRKIQRLLSEEQRRGVVAMVVVMLKGLAHQHRMLSNLDPLRPLPGETALTYDALADGLRFALNVTSEDICHAAEILDSVDVSRSPETSNLQGGGEAAAAEAEPEHNDDAATGAAKRDLDDFWHSPE